MKNVFFFLCLLVLACGSNDSDYNSSNNYSTSQGAALTQIVLVDTLNNAMGEVTLGSSPSIVVGHKDYSSKFKKGKLKYYDDNGQCVVKVSYKSDGFKLKREDGSLLWKVKLKSNKIKLANNEEMLNPYQLKRYEDPSEAKLKVGDETLGKVKAKPNKLKVTYGSSVYYLYDQRNLDYGVVGFEEIPLLYRMMILVELAKK